MLLLSLSVAEKSSFDNCDWDEAVDGEKIQAVEFSSP